MRFNEVWTLKIKCNNEALEGSLLLCIVAMMVTYQKSRIISALYNVPQNLGRTILLALIYAVGIVIKSSINTDKNRASTLVRDWCSGIIEYCTGDMKYYYSPGCELISLTHKILINHLQSCFKDSSSIRTVFFFIISNTLTKYYPRICGEKKTVMRKRK